MERYHFSYMLAAMALHDVGVGDVAAMKPVHDGIQKIGGALEEVARCVPEPDYPILVAILRATADAIEGSMPPGGSKLSKMIRESVQTVVVKQEIRHSKGGADNG